MNTQKIIKTAYLFSPAVVAAPLFLDQIDYFTAAILMLSIVLTFRLWETKKELAEEKEAHYSATRHHISLVGTTHLWEGYDDFAYNLKSFDGGLTWYAVEFDDERRMTIKGKADELYPGLVDTLYSVQKLGEVIRKNAGIDLLKGENRIHLEKTGFTFKSLN